MGYTPSFTPEYEGGWEDLPLETTPITADALNNYDDAIGNIEEYLADNEIVEIEANPTETATDSLTKINIGGEIYEIEGGGGGSDVSITPTLSTGTKIADFEIDGVEGELYAPTGGGGNANIWTGTQAEYEAQASQIADDTVVLITDDEEHTQAFDIYSTDEQVIGTWIDGSTLYRRVVPFTSARTSVQVNTWVELPEVDASNILQVTNSVLINYSAETPNYRVNIPCMCSTNRDAFNQHLAFAHLRPTAVSFPVGNMIIIEYTKITD